jgi:hypothetical protein
MTSILLLLALASGDPLREVAVDIAKLRAIAELEHCKEIAPCPPPRRCPACETCHPCPEAPPYQIELVCAPPEHDDVIEPEPVVRHVPWWVPAIGGAILGLSLGALVSR